MGGFLNKVLLVDLFRGLWVTFQNQSPKYIYIEQYPTERPRIAERYRGAPRLNVNPDTNETLCISCNLCALACPENLIGNERAERADPPQGPDDIYLRPITLHVSVGCARTPVDGRGPSSSICRSQILPSRV